MLIIDLKNKHICGSARARDIRKYGLIQASRLNNIEKPPHSKNMPVK